MSKKIIQTILLFTLLGALTALKTQQIILNPLQHNSDETGSQNLIEENQYTNSYTKYNTTYPANKKEYNSSYTTKKSVNTYEKQKTYSTSQQQKVYTTKSDNYDKYVSEKADNMIHNSNVTIVEVFQQIEALQQNQIKIQKQNIKSSEQKCRDQIEKFQCQKKQIWTKEQYQLETKIDSLTSEQNEKSQMADSLYKKIIASKEQTRRTCDNVNKQASTLESQIDCISKIQTIVKSTIAELNVKMNQQPDYHEKLQKINHYFIQMKQDDVHPLTKAFIEMSEVLLYPQKNYTATKSVKADSYSKDKDYGSKILEDMYEESYEKLEDEELYQETKIKKAMEQILAILTKLQGVLRKKVEELRKQCSQSKYQTEQLETQSNYKISALKSKITQILSQINEKKERNFKLKGNIKACEDIKMLIAQCDQEHEIGLKILRELQDALILIQEIIKKLIQQPNLLNY